MEKQSGRKTVKTNFRREDVKKLLEEKPFRRRNLAGKQFIRSSLEGLQFRQSLEGNTLRRNQKKSRLKEEI